MPEVDWRRVAVRLALAGDGSYYRLSTTERDVLDAAVRQARDAEWPSGTHQRIRCGGRE